MKPIHPYRPNAFAGSPLDRMDARRRDTDWVAGVLADPSTRFLPVWRTRSFVAGEPARPMPGFLPAREAASFLPRVPWTVLGQHDGENYVALDLSAEDDPVPDGGLGRFEDLRRVGGLLLPADAAILAHARGLMHWRTRHRFCGVCGAGCMAEQAGHVMVCGGCGTHHFPRTDPAVIMLVTHGERALLGMPTRFRDLRMFTTLAGFVEPGESLEEAVAREVYEEAGVRVGDVRYRSSQPWPFPASIMLGFTAEAEDDTLTVDPQELADAGWFSRDALRTPDGFALPPPMSIARRLIDDWIEDNSPKP